MKSSLLTKEAWDSTTNEAWRRSPAPSVSVVIALYNYEAYIEGCLNSVLASQTDGIPGGIEVIVIDDASTDSSLEIVEAYVAASPLAMCLVKKKLNTGVADTRNLGLLIARAPFIFMLDADNEIRPECLRAHHAALAASGHAMAYGIINRFDDATGKSLGTISDSEWDVRKLVYAPYIDTMAMIRKDVVLRVGGYSVDLKIVVVEAWDDYDLWLKLAQAGYTGKFIPQILSDYRVKAGSMIIRALPAQREFSAYMSRKFFALAHAHGDTTVLFGSPRHELEAAYPKPGRLVAPTAGAAVPRPIHRFLGKKLRRSLNKRLNAIYAWLNG